MNHPKPDPSTADALPDLRPPDPPPAPPPVDYRSAKPRALDEPVEYTQSSASCRLEFSPRAAWLAVLITPCAAAALLLALSIAEVGTLRDFSDTLTLASHRMVGVACESLLIAIALFLTALIFRGLDLPSLPNRLWKLPAILTLDLVLFHVICWLIGYQGCLMIGYFMVLRPIVIGSLLMVCYGTDMTESAITLLITWGALCILLLSSLSRGLLLGGYL